MMLAAASAVPPHAGSMEMSAGAPPGKLQSIRPVAGANRSWGKFLAAITFSFLDQD
jgi:hypothetical protein